MLIYFIDAFNVIHKVSKLRDSKTPRIDFINHIIKDNLTGSSNNKTIVVFDGYPPISDNPKGKPHGSCEILFSYDVSADSVIKKMVSNSKNKKQVVVVTDDRSIKDFVRNLGAVLLSAGDFIAKVRKSFSDAIREDISLSLQSEITSEMRKIWLKE